MKLDTVKLFVKGLNWQVILLKLAVIASLGTIMFVLGVKHGEAECFEEKIAAAEKETTQIREFVPIINKQEKAASEQSVRMGKKAEVYYEDVIKADRDSGCDLTDDELRSFQSLVEG